MQINEVFKLVQDDMQRVEKEISSRLNMDNPLISAVSKHIFNSGGKRMRPMLLLLCSKLCNYQGNMDVIYAVSIEFIHVATLLHDDVIDESETRRGAPSANAKWGAKIPVLVGDYLYSMANIMLSSEGNAGMFATASDAIMEVSDGEILEDLKKHDPTITEAEYLEIIIKKTAALFYACCKMGAILGGQGEEGQDALTNYGLKMGIAFQMMDDVLDFVASEKKLGKPLGNDLREGNITIPIIRLFEKTNPAEKERLQEILKNPQGSDDELKYVLGLLENYKIVQAIYTEACQYIEEAKASLSIFEDNRYRQALCAVADYVVSRDY